MTELILGLLDTSDRIADRRIAEKARSLTIDWSRFKYSGPIVEARELDVLLERAEAHGRRWCLVQPYGHVLGEIWRHEDTSSSDVLRHLAEWLNAHQAAVADASTRDSPPGTCLVVDLERWRVLGRPPVTDLQPTPLPPHLLPAALHLRPEEPEMAAELGRFLNEGIAEFDRARPSAFGDQALAFLELIRVLVGNLRRGVFVWNVESYGIGDLVVQSFFLDRQQLVLHCPGTPRDLPGLARRAGTQSAGSLSLRCQQRQRQRQRGAGRGIS